MQRILGWLVVEDQPHSSQRLLYLTKLTQIYLQPIGLLSVPMVPVLSTPLEPTLVLLGVSLSASLPASASSALSEWLPSLRHTP